MRFLFFVLRFVYVMTACLVSSSVFAQAPLDVTDYSFERSYRYRQTIQPRSNELVAIYGRGDWFFYSNRLFLRRHSFNGGAPLERNLVLTANHQSAYLLHAFSHDTSLYFVCAVDIEKKSSKSWGVIRYNVASDKLTVVVELQAANAISSNALLYGDITVVWSSDSSRLAVCVTSNGETGLEKIHALSLNATSPQQFKTMTLSLPDPITHYEHQRFLTDENGIVYALGKQYIDGSSEMKGTNANYNYVVMKATEAGFKMIGSIASGNSILRSFDAVIVDNTLHGTGFASDTTLALHDSLLTVGMQLSDGRMVYKSVVPLTQPPAITNAHPNRFENNVSFENNKLVSRIEIRHISYNESARAGSGFTYERGLGVVLVSGLDGKIELTHNTLKSQTFDQIPLTSFQTFYHQGVLYSAHIAYRDDGSRASILTIENLKTGEETIRIISHVDWEKDSPYELFKLPNALVGIQAGARKYHVFSVPLK